VTNPLSVEFDVRGRFCFNTALLICACRYNVRISVENSLLDNSTYLPQYNNATVIAAIGINDSTVVMPLFVKTNYSHLISLLPLTGESLLIIAALLN